MEEALRDANDIVRQSQSEIDAERAGLQAKLKKLISQRQGQPDADTERRAEISKKMKRQIDRTKRYDRRSRVKKILGEFKGVKSIAGVKTRRRKVYIPGVKDSSEEIQTDRQTICGYFDLSTRNCTPTGTTRW